MVSSFTKSFRCELLTPTETAYRSDAVSVVFPAVDGSVGVLGGRAPLVAMIGSGRLVVVGPSGSREEFYVAGGFAHVRENRMTILAEECTALKDLDPEKVWDELQSARSAAALTDAEFAAREQAIAAARVKFALAQEKHKPRERA